MNSSAPKQGHHPYRRGERRRKLFTTERAVPPIQEGALFQHTLPNPPVRGAVLVVEPEASLRWHLGNALLNRGYSVAEATTATQAIAQLEQKAFDLLLLDLDLPDDTSWRLLRVLATSPTIAPQLIILPERQRDTEQRVAALPGRVGPEPSWLADLLRLVERIRSAPGPPEGSAEGRTVHVG